MAQRVIFAEQTLEGFSTDAGFGYSYIQDPPTFSLVAGETYNVLWGDTTYTGLTAYEAEIDGDACVYIGDGSALGYPGNGEMFAIICFDTFNMLSSYADSASSRTVAIYQEAVITGEALLPEQTLTATTSGSNTFELQWDASEALVVGETYGVLWEGKCYECVAYGVETEGYTECVLLGNQNVAEGGLSHDPVEPFWIIYTPASVTGTVDKLEIDCVTEGCSSDTHTVAIYKEVEYETPGEDAGTDTEEPVPEDTSIVLKDRNGNDVVYDGIKTVTFDTPEDGVQATFTLGVEQTGKEVELDLAAGDQTVKADAGHLLRALTIKKPADLLPENIRNGKTVGGVDGNFIGDTEEIIIGESEGATPLDFAEGNQEVVPTAEGKVISKITIEKPANLLPENIAEGIDIGGIIGTFVGGGDAPKVVVKEFINVVTSGVVIIFTAEELAGIGFAEASKKFVLLMPIEQVYSYETGHYSVAFNIIRAPKMTNKASGTTASGNLYGITVYNSRSSSSSSSYSVAYVTDYPFGTTAKTDTMYMADGAVVYDLTNSTYKLRESSSRSGNYVAIAGVTD